MFKVILIQLRKIVNCTALKKAQIRVKQGMKKGKKKLKVIEN